MKILHIVGNRPQFIKLAPFLKATQKYPAVANVLVHSGQHYDYAMSKIFFEELGIPDVHYNLEVGSGTSGFQTGKILMELAPLLAKEHPDAVVVYGDTNTTLAGALAAYQLHIPLAHVEAGMRENIWRPEEINKKTADHCSDYCFCPLRRAGDNLLREGIAKERIIFTGDITYDTFLMNIGQADAKGSIDTPAGDYILMTMHRAETVDVPERVRGILDAITKSEVKVIFPMHPRTRERLKSHGLYAQLEKSKSVEIIEPVGYFEFLKLMKHCRIVITDSSGVLKEAFYAEKMCVTVDDTTEYREIFDLGRNVLAGTQAPRISREISRMLDLRFEKIAPSSHPFGDGRAAEKMLSAMIP